MRLAFTLIAIGLAAASLVAAPAEAKEKTCKDAVTAKSRSTIKASDEAREKRAQNNATVKWSKLAQITYGWSYRFWYRAEEKKVECTGTAKSKTCNVSAKPCALF
jgi:glucose dehydrogenase